MSQMLGWAVNPMVRRVEQLSKNVPVTAIYGEDSWMNKAGGEKLKDIRKDAYTKVHVSFRTILCLKDLGTLYDRKHNRPQAYI